MNMKSTAQIIPESLIYEMVKGKPIYYKNYNEFLKGNKQIEELTGSSVIQSRIITRLVVLLELNLDLEYEVLTNELGIQFEKKSWRAADLAIVKTKEIDEIEAKNKYLGFAPEIVIEIDTKADLSEIKNPSSYYHEKTDELLNFGVKKVVWIFTETKKVMIAEKNNKWVISSWNENFDILNANINIEKLLKKRKR